MTLKQATLANGLQVSCINPFQVADIERQVAQYFAHGIEVRAGDTVFDVGANIGLFSLLVAARCEGDVRVYAFEPIPAVYAALEANLRMFGQERLKSFNLGLARAAGKVVFAYRPNMPTLSSMYGDDQQEMRNQVETALLKNLSSTPWHLRWLNLMPSFVRSFFIRKTVNSAFESEEVECRLARLSDIVSREGVERIDLLKVDVEKSELEVLLGIDDDDWARIQQVVMEIHDIDDRLSDVERLLEKHGISEIVVEQERLLEGSNVYALYARRPVTEDLPEGGSSAPAACLA